MMQDLSEPFRHALAISTPWSHENVEQALQALAARCPGACVDWEPGDEEWGRVINTDGGVIGLVCARVPLGAARDDLAPSELPDSVVWLRFKTMHEPAYQVTRELLEEVFGRPISQNINYESLSLNDLWWATVS